MRFTKKEKPDEGTRRTVKKFAFLPKSITKSSKAWLEHYYSHQVWTKVIRNVDGMNVEFETWMEVGRTWCNK